MNKWLGEKPKAKHVAVLIGRALYYIEVLRESETDDFVNWETWTELPTYFFLSSFQGKVLTNSSTAVYSKSMKHPKLVFKCFYFTEYTHTVM
jgi:hypothetical protein